MGGKTMAKQIMQRDLSSSDVERSQERLAPEPGLQTTPEQKSEEVPATMSEDIARLAYALYELRGRTDGSDVEDWLQAERQLAQEKGV
jgi:hypothetical protein